MPGCTEESTLNHFRIGGSVDTYCKDGALADRIIVKTQLNTSAPTVDPTTCAVIPASERVRTFVLAGTERDSDPADAIVVDEADWGCWCSCELKPNYGSVDPESGLQPGDSYYSLSVTLNQGNSTTVIYKDVEVRLDGDHDYSSDFTSMSTATCDGDVIDMCKFTPPEPTTPPTDLFTQAVREAETPWLGEVDSSDMSGILEITPGDVNGGTPKADGHFPTFGINGEALTDFVDSAVSITTDGDATGVTDNPDGAFDITVTSTDADNLAVIGTDGGTLVTAEAVQDAVGETLGAVSGLVYDDANDSITALSTDVDNLATIGTDGAIAVKCADLDDCMDGHLEANLGALIVTSGDLTKAVDPVTGAVTIGYVDVPTTLTSFTSVVNPDGSVSITVLLSDNSTGTVTVPAPPDDIYVTSSTYSALVDNGNGTSTITNTITLSDATVLTPTFTIPNPTVNTDTWITPTGLDINPATGNISFTYTDQNGATQTLTDTVTPFADTNTTNSTFTWNETTNTATITDSDNNALNIVIGQASMTANADGSHTFTNRDGATVVLPAPVPFACTDLNNCSIESLSNVGGAPTDGQVLTWDAVTSSYLPATVAAGTPDTTVEVTGISTLTDVTAAGVRTVTWRLTEEDDGDANPAFHDFAISIPEGASDTTCERLDWSYDQFCSAPSCITPKVALKTGNITRVAIAAASVSNGAEAWNVKVNGTTQTTLTLPSATGSALSAVVALPVTIGDVITVEPSGAVPSTPSECGSVQLTICGAA